MNVLLVNETVRDSHVFLESVNATTRAILYGDQTDLLNELQKTGPIEQLGIVFVKGMTFMGKRFEDQVDLLNTAISQFQIKRIDFLACSTLPEWSDFYAKLTTVVGASSDLTGNLKYGGNWVMESTGQDIEAVYFTKSIEYYKYLLDSGSWGGNYTMVTLSDGYVYGMGSILFSTPFGINNGRHFTSPVTYNQTPITGIQKIAAGSEHLVYLKDNEIYGIGWDRRGQIGGATLQEPDGWGVYTNTFIKMTKPAGSPGLITDIACGGPVTIIIMDGKVYGRGEWINQGQFQLLLIDGVDDTNKLATKLYGGHNCFYVVMGGQLYTRGDSRAQGTGPNSEGKSRSYTNTIKMDYPTGITTLPKLIANGPNHALFVFGDDNKLYGVGTNGEYMGENVPNTVDNIVGVLTPLKFNNADISGVTAVACNNGNSWWVKDNVLYGVGSNFYGEIGPGYIFGTSTRTPRIVPTPAGTIQELFTQPESYSWVYLLMTNGNLYGVGENNYGQLGENTQPKNTFTLIDTGVTSIQAGTNTGYYLKSGTLYGIGSNRFGQLGYPIFGKLGALTPIMNGTEQMTMKKYSKGEHFSVADIGGVLHGCGWNQTENLVGLGPEVRTSKYMPIELPVGHTGTISFIRCTSALTLAVKGNVIYSNYKRTWNNTTPIPPLRVLPFPKDPSGNTITGTIQDIDCGDPNYLGTHILVIIDTKLYGLGSNNYYALGNSSGGYITDFTPIMFDVTPCTNVTKVACSGTFSIFVMNGLLYGMGAGLDPVVTGTQRFVVTNIPLPVTGTIDAISCGSNYFYVVIGGNLYGAGANEYGQLGPTAANPQATVVALLSGGVPITGVTGINCYTSTAFITKGKNLYGVGRNQNNQLGGTLSNPVTMMTLITDQLFVDGVTIDQMSPISGTTDTVVTITGDRLNTVTSVVTDTTATAVISGASVTCTILNKVSATLSFKIPAGNGYKYIKLITEDKNYVVSGQFVYRNPMIISSFSSYVGTKNKIINIKGDDLTKLAKVKFNGIVTTSFYEISSTEYAVIVPDSTSGTVILEDIYNVNSTPAIYFEYKNPTITSLSATSGKQGDTLTINGLNLDNIKTVYFGNTVATIVGVPTTTNVVVQVPLELGTVSIRIYDAALNMTASTQTFQYVLAPVEVGAVQAVVISSTVDTTGQKYYSLLEGATYFIVKYIDATTFTKLFSSTNPIRGLVFSGTSLYFCDPVARSIRSISSTTTVMLTTATTLFTRSTMTPEAIKTKDAKLFVVCKNVGVGTDDSIVIADMTGTVLSSIPYTDFSTYTLQGITTNPAEANVVYVTAVLYPTPSANTGRVFRLNTSGANPTPTLIQGLTNPIDLTFANGYLIVDGIINVYSPTGTLVSTLNTTANSIVTTINLGVETVSFTSVNENGTTSVNQLTIPPNVGSEFKLTEAYSPIKGPEGTVVTIVGYNITAGDILKVEIKDSLNVLYEISRETIQVTSNLVAVRMPNPITYPTKEVKIVVTHTNGTSIFDYSYQSPDLINIIPLYKGDVKYFHFTGNNLQNIQYIEFVDTSTNELSANKLPVTNVTAISFDCSFVTVPVNTTRCLMLDAFGNTIKEDAYYFSLSSETCFLGGTPILTDQGEVSIDKIDCAYHTLDKKPIVAITKIRYSGDTLIRIEKDALRKNYPTQDTVISRKHKIYYKGKMKKAESFIRKEGVQVIPYGGQYLYNVLLETHETMRVNGLLCETLYPKNPIAKFFTRETESILSESCDSRMF